MGVGGDDEGHFYRCNLVLVRGGGQLWTDESVRW